MLANITALDGLVIIYISIPLLILSAAIYCSVQAFFMARDNKALYLRIPDRAVVRWKEATNKQCQRCTKGYLTKITRIRKHKSMSMRGKRFYFEQLSGAYICDNVECGYRGISLRN